MADTIAESIEAFVQSSMRKHGRVVPARLQAALALLEKLRMHTSLTLTDHLASKGSSGLESHETHGNAAHKRLNLEPINKNHGRRSSSLQDWGQDLLDIFKDAGFVEAKSRASARIIDRAQAVIAGHLKGMLEQSPLEVRVKGRSAEAIIRDVLMQAEEKGKAGEVAQYLVGAKLSLRFDIRIPIYPMNKGDRKSRLDRGARRGDFEIEDAVIEVAVGLPDDKHLAQIDDALDDMDVEVWLLTRGDRAAMWESALKSEGVNISRVVVTSVEAFVGQNITELGSFSAKGKAVQLQALFELYNSTWMSQVGTPGIRIEIR